MNNTTETTGTIDDKAIFCQLLEEILAEYEQNTAAYRKAKALKYLSQYSGQTQKPKDFYSVIASGIGN